ncbi:MAG TPA: macro domain-containing protein [Polyangiaceae bacterium]|jgi:O-acetyl-ADP-ribose deacetylase (regulator of RNase III)|nr:macro domain-containing protein [Polyangiaceae bacterium]
MPAIFEKGDIFHTDGLRAYAHGCDCAGQMDKGVAVAFKKKWPLMYEEYRARCQDGRFRLGDVFAWSEGDDVVYSLGIQEQSTQKPKISALTKSLKTTAELAQKVGIERVGLPRIGAGQGGLDWPRVKKVLSEVGQNTSVTFVVFEQFIRSASP